MLQRTVLCFVLVGGLALIAPPASAGVWSEQEVIGLEDNYTDYTPEVAIDPQGRVWVVWMGVDETGTHDYETYWSRWEEGSGWLPRQRVNPDNGLYDAWPRLSMAPDGTPWTAWLKRRSTGAWDILSSRWSAGAWTVPDTVVGGSGISEGTYHGMAAVDSTHCWVVYNFANGVRARQYQGDHWGPIEQVVSGMDHYPLQVDAALGPDSQPWASWSDGGIEATRRRADGSWEVPVLLDPPGGRGAGSPSISVDDRGEGWLVWGEPSYWCPPNDWDDIFWSRTNGGIWQPFQVVSVYETSNCGSDGWPDIACAYGWPPLASWSRRYPGSASVSYEEPFSAGWDSIAWSPQCQINAADSVVHRDDRYVVVARGPEGAAWAAWNRTGRHSPYYDIYASRLLLDIVRLDVQRNPARVEIGWHAAGYGPRSDYLFAVMRSNELGDSMQIGDTLMGRIRSANPGSPASA